MIHTEGIKYAGSKLKLLPYISNIVDTLEDVHSVLDGFSGTTRVSQMFAQKGINVTANDISYWSEIFGKCYLLKAKSDSYYLEIIDYLNSLEGKYGWFSENYGGEEEESKKAFKMKNMNKLDSIREEIDNLKLSDMDKAVILSSLILALDKVDSTIGHFTSFLQDWSFRSKNELKLELPRRFLLSSDNSVYRGDVFNLLDGYKYDLAYFDPPYGSNNEKMPTSRVRYNSYYNFWTTVILNDKPKLFGKALRREDSRDSISGSVFEEFRKDSDGHYIAMKAIEKLINECDAHYILLSYSSKGRATKEELIDIINTNGKLMNIYEIDYRKNVMAGMRSTNEWANDDSNKEYLILFEK